jgi:uncharacterized membrane protein YhiD involved in acid resistance
MLMAQRAPIEQRPARDRPEDNSGEDDGRRAPLAVVGLLVVLAVIALVISSGGARMLGAPPAPSTPDAGAGSSSPSLIEFQRATGVLAQALPTTTADHLAILFRLLLAAFLGAAISFRGSRRRNEYQIVHTNMILAFTGAMMMIIVGSDLARAFGLVGASSIVRYRTPVHDPKALASLFVSMGAGIAVGVGLYELAIGATILVILIEIALERGGLFISRGWYRPERSYELNLETDTPEETLQSIRSLFGLERISHMLVDYDRGKKSENVKIGMVVGLPEGMDTEKLTLQILGAGARSVSWRLSKEQ